MSDGATGAASNGTPNGTSAATTPAAGVSTPTPTPKNGEGAVVPKQAEGWKPIKTKLPLRERAGFPEEEVEIGSEEELQRIIFNAKQADRASKKAAEAERREQQRKEALAKKDYAPLKDLGFDPDAYFMERLQDELRKEQMKPEERAKEEHENRVKQAEARAKAAEERARQIEAQVAEEKEWATLQPRLGQAMRDAGMLDDTHAWEEVSRVAQDFLAQGLDVPPEVVIKEAAARDKAKFDERLSKLTQQTAPALWGKLPPEVRKVFGYLAAQEHIKARSNIPPPSEPVPEQVSEEKKEQPVSLSERAFLRKLGR